MRRCGVDGRWGEFRPIQPREPRGSAGLRVPLTRVAVAGRPETKYGEVVAAWVIPESGATVTPDEPKRYCQGKIARFKIPQYISIEESFPQNVNGKTLKRVLREQKIAELGLVEVARIETTRVGEDLP